VPVPPRPYSPTVIRERVPHPGDGAEASLAVARPAAPPLGRRVAANTAVQVGGLVVGTLLSFGFLRLATWYLGVDRFGDLAIVMTLGALVVTLADLGVATTLARELARHAERSQETAARLLAFRIASSALITLLVLAAIPFSPYAGVVKQALALSLVGVFFTSVGTFSKAFFQVNLTLQRQAALDLTQKTLNLAALGVAIWIGVGLLPVVALLAAANVVVAAASFRLVRPYWRPGVRFSASKETRTLVRSAVAIGLVSMIGLLHYRGDAVLLSLLKPARDVGIYSIAYRFIDQAFVLPGFFMAAVFPTLTRYAHSADRERRDRLVNRAFQVLLVGAVLVALAVYTLAPLLVRVVAGPAFHDAVEPSRILAPALVFLFVSPVFYNLLIAMDRQSSLVWLGIVALALNVALTLALIPRFSYNGAAAATVASEGFTCCCTFLLCRRLAGARVDWSPVGRVLAAAGAAVAAAVLLRGASVVAFVAGEAIFLGGVFALRAFRWDEVRLVLGRRPG